jgi:hypothetical protein
MKIIETVIVVNIGTSSFSKIYIAKDTFGNLKYFKEKLNVQTAYIELEPIKESIYFSLLANTVKNGNKN